MLFVQLGNGHIPTWKEQFWKFYKACMNKLLLLLDLLLKIMVNAIIRGDYYVHIIHLFKGCAQLKKTIGKCLKI